MSDAEPGRTDDSPSPESERDAEAREGVVGEAPLPGETVYPENDPTHGQPVDEEGNPLVPEDETEEEAATRKNRETEPRNK